MDEVDFIFQFGNLKRTPRSGWLSIGIKNCESVAEHSSRTAIIAYILAKNEGLSETDAKEASFMALLHDIHESRIGDLHKLAKSYMEIDKQKAIEDSLSPFGNIMHTKNPKINIIVKDADILEMFFTAKEYLDEGNSYAEKWLAPDKLKTDSAKKIHEKMAKRDSRAWLLGAIKW